MPKFSRGILQTMASAYEEIRAGETPWVALGNFMNDWFMYHPDRRAELIADPPIQPETPTLEERRWAVFIAASVEYLCQQYNLLCPEWVQKGRYHLDEPWYHARYAHKEVRIRLEATTPEPFKRRNIFCGNRVYLDKREILAHPGDFLTRPLLSAEDL